MSVETKTCEYNSNNAYIFNGNNGKLNNNNKYNSNSVRRVSDFQNEEELSFLELFESFEIAYRVCLRNKNGTANAIRFKINEGEYLLKLCKDIYNFEYTPRPSIAFVITYPCPREVIAADFSDRIVQHWIVMRLEQLFEKCNTLPDEMYSCRVGKGNLAALKAVREKIFRVSQGYRKPCFVAKFDVSSFFMSIDKRILYDELVKLVQEEYHEKDKDLLLYLLRITTFSIPVEHAIRKCPLSLWENVPRHKSQYFLEWFLALAIGNLESQTDANFYNAPAVRWLLNIRGLFCVNYVDDFLLVSDDRRTIHDTMYCARQFFHDERGLEIHPTKYNEQDYTKGMKFLGGVVKFGRLYINNRTVGKLEKKMHYYDTVYASTRKLKQRHVEKYVSIINSYFGLMKHFSSYNIRKREAEEILKYWKGYIVFSEDLTKASIAKNHTRKAQYLRRAHAQHRKDLQTLKTFDNGNSIENQRSRARAERTPRDNGEV